MSVKRDLVNDYTESYEEHNFEQSNQHQYRKPEKASTLNTVTKSRVSSEGITKRRLRSVTLKNILRHFFASQKSSRGESRQIIPSLTLKPFLDFTAAPTLYHFHSPIIQSALNCSREFTDYYFTYL